MSLYKLEWIGNGGDRWSVLLEHPKEYDEMRWRRFIHHLMSYAASVLVRKGEDKAIGIPDVLKKVSEILVSRFQFKPARTLVVGFYGGNPLGEGDRDLEYVFGESLEKVISHNKEVRKGGGSD